MLIDKNIHTVYIYCPSGYASGGPEVLHQLGYKLKENGIKVFMVYYPKTSTNPVHNNYKEYKLGWVDTAPDVKNAFVVLPETFSDLHRGFKKSSVVIWWLSVDNYFLGSLNKFKKYVNGIIKEIFDYNPRLFFDSSLLENDYYHFVQSKYAELFLLEKGFRRDYIYTLSDYLHHNFLSHKYDNTWKKNIVVYNPSKGFRFTKKIIKENKDITFIPLSGMTRNEVKNLLRESKLYIDFGPHPGKDRIPREAVCLGCCILVGKNGSANNRVDINIPEEYKFDCSQKEINEISLKIRAILDNYDTCYRDFKEYINGIEKERKKFEVDLLEILK